MCQCRFAASWRSCPHDARLRGCFSHARGVRTLFATGCVIANEALAELRRRVEAGRPASILTLSEVLGRLVADDQVLSQALADVVEGV